MPELPETETIARDLDAAIAGGVLQHAVVHRADVLREMDAHAFRASFEQPWRVTRAWRRAKCIVLDLARLDDARIANVRDDDEPATGAPDRSPELAHLVVQPRFTGALLVDDGDLPTALADYHCVSFTLGDGRRLHYRDVRRLGTVSLMSPVRFAEYVGALGREPLDDAFTPAVLSELLRSSRRPVKQVLMDQYRLAGVGNIYANEALWRAGIDPSRAAATIGSDERDALHAALQAVLRESIALRGTSFRDYTDARGERGGFVARLAAYGRGGEPCLRCGRRLVETHAVDGRSTVLCVSCQR